LTVDECAKSGDVLKAERGCKLAERPADARAPRRDLATHSSRASGERRSA
jgi:hypothetical protein